MMAVEFQYRDKIPVAVLGATGSVGQRFLALLASHPWFEVVAVAASDRSVGKVYKEAVNWLLPAPLSEEIGNLTIQPCAPPLPCKVIFSALDSAVAGDIETEFAKAGFLVFTNAQNHRMDEFIPLLIPEINSSHLELLKQQPYGKGKIIATPNCTACGLVLALKPLQDLFGIESVQVTTLQAISGAGYPGVASLDIVDNTIPYIRDEENKVETEPNKIFGAMQEGHLQFAGLKISAQCNRVCVTDGHSECVSVKLKKKAAPNEIIKAWETFKGEPQELILPTAPIKPIHYFSKENYPQAKIHRLLDKGMAVSIGRLRECPVLDYKFIILSNNVIRGAAGGTILNAELLVKKGYVFW